MDFLQNIANRIKELCDDKGISVNKMLSECDAGERTYHNIKAGSAPSVDKIYKIANYFNISVDYLLGIENKKGVKSMNKDTIIFTDENNKKLCKFFDNYFNKKDVGLFHFENEYSEVPFEVRKAIHNGTYVFTDEIIDYFCDIIKLNRNAIVKYLDPHYQLKYKFDLLDEEEKSKVINFIDSILNKTKHINRMTVQESYVSNEGLIAQDTLSVDINQEDTTEKL